MRLSDSFNLGRVTARMQLRCFDNRGISGVVKVGKKLQLWIGRVTRLPPHRVVIRNLSANGHCQPFTHCAHAGPSGTVAVAT
jgi:hypothetical protein